MRKLTNLLFFAAVASQAGATNCGEVLRDPGYDLWCGEELCAWKVERGEIKRVATWNEGDSGVELIGTDTAIEQLTPLDSADGYCRDLPDGGSECTYPADVCLEFSLLANVDDKAVVDLNVDVFNDGTIDHTQRLPIGKWQPIAYKIVLRKPFAGVRFELAKSGTGTAQLANIGAKLARNCEGLPVIDARPAPLGSPCEAGTDCASGICGSLVDAPFHGTISAFFADSVCLGCDFGDHACGSGQTCGVVEPASPVRADGTACVAVGSRQLGEQCTADHRDAVTQAYVSECATGYCTDHVCSTCGLRGSTVSGCAASESCDKAWAAPTDGWGVHAPSVCSPHAHLRAAGEACANHDDCASSVCLGNERSQCDDGRSCVTAAQCPFEDGLKSGACTTVGIQGGICQ